MEQRSITHCPTPTVPNTTYKEGQSLLEVLCQVFCSVSLSLFPPYRLHILFISPSFVIPNWFFSHSFFSLYFSEGNFVYIINGLETNLKAKVKSSRLMQIPWKHPRTKRAHSNYFLRTFLQHPTICSSQSHWAKCKMKFFMLFIFLTYLIQLLIGFMQTSTIYTTLQYRCPQLNYRWSDACLI